MHMCEQNYGVISVWLNISYDSGIVAVVLQ